MEHTMQSEHFELARALGQHALAQHMRLTTAESCTGGLIAATLTDIPGCSQWFERGFVTYTDQAKQDMLSVSAETLKRFGAVSEQTASEMALGALQHSTAHLSVSVSGIAGPDGGSVEKPVGLVCFAFAKRAQKKQSPEIIQACSEHFSGNRAQIRSQSVAFALKQLLEYLDKFRSYGLSDSQRS